MGQSKAQKLVGNLGRMWDKLDPVDDWRPVLNQACDELRRLSAIEAEVERLRAAPAPVAQPSPTAGMNIAQRILHVGGRNNSAGYVEFGSIQAVEALVYQVLRDIRGTAPIPDSVLVGMYDERPSSDADMIEFARAVEAAHGIKDSA